MIRKLLIASLVAAALTAGAADIIPFSEEVPVINGSASDKVWEKQDWNVSGKLEYKASSDGSKIFFIVKFNSPAPHCEERRWVWDSAAGIYVPGKETEDTLNVVIAPGAGGASLFADLWVWRAGRTDPMASADDLYISYDSGTSAPQIFPDKGQAPWYSRYFSAYAGDIIKRFCLRKPSGSAADVSAKGIWHEGVWTVEFSRKLDTGNIDDVRLNSAEPFQLFFFPERELPGKFDFISFQIGKEPLK